MVVPPAGDLFHALYDAMPAGAVALRTLGVELSFGEVDLIHLHHPERLVARGQTEEDSYRSDYRRFIDTLGASMIRVVWTMHNRRPHKGDAGWGKELYAAWARIADAVIHQSHWGMDLMVDALPYRTDAHHEIIPLGHLGANMPPNEERPLLERSMGMTHCALRFGVLGNPLRAKRVDMIMRAFSRGAGADRQLLVTAVEPGAPIPDDPRVTVIPRRTRADRSTVNMYLRVCDALVCAHRGESYLCSGQVSDAIGAGIPILAGSLPFFREIMRDAARYFDDTEAGLTELFARLTPEDIETGKRRSTALQEEYSWGPIADRTLRLFREVL